MRSNKRDDTKGTAIMVLSFLGIAGFFGYYIMKGDTDRKTMIMSVVFVLLIFAWTIAEVVTYRNKYFKLEDKDKTFFKRRKQERKRTDVYKQTVTGKDMYDACRKYVRERNISDTVIIIFIQLIFVGVFLLTAGTAIHWGFYVGVPLFLTTVFYIWVCRKSKDVKKLKEFMANSPYDEMMVNNDFMAGTKHVLKTGLICIGMQYVVVCHYEGAFVCELSDVRQVLKIVEEYRSGDFIDYKAELYAVKILLNQGSVTLPCMDELSTDLLIEEFKHRGYF